MSDKKFTMSFLPLETATIPASKLSILTCIAVAALLLFLVQSSIRSRRSVKQLDGPWGLPYIGRVHDLDPAHPYRKTTEWLFKYNFICQSTMMGEKHVWIGSPKIARALLEQRAAIYSSRPPVHAVPGSDTLPHYLPLMASGEAWNRHRHFYTTALITSHNAHYHGVIEEEVILFLQQLLNQPKGYYALIDSFTGRLSARLNYGSPASAAAHIRNAYEFIPQISPSGPKTNLMPFLAHLPEWLNTSKREVRERREREAVLWQGLLTNFRTAYDAGTAQPPCHARLYFDRKKNGPSVDGKAAPPFEPSAATNPSAFGFAPDDAEFAYALGMLTTVAIFTVGGLLNTFFLSMVCHPDWQSRVRSELDAVLGSRLVPSKSDVAHLPILRAVLKESLRWRPAVPLGVPRLVEADNEYDGCVISKGTIAHVVEMALARDPEVYPDAEAFRPERWLEAGWPTYREPLTRYPTLQGHHQFGFGRRVCPGVAYTEAAAVSFCGGLLRCFELRRKVGSDGREVVPDTWDRTSNLIGGPLEFEFSVVVREGIKESLAGMKEAA